MELFIRGYFGKKNVSELVFRPRSPSCYCLGSFTASGVPHRNFNLSKSERPWDVSVTMLLLTYIYDCRPQRQDLISSMLLVTINVSCL